jgi:hypothetical protein
MMTINIQKRTNSQEIALLIHFWNFRKKRSNLVYDCTTQFCVPAWATCHRAANRWGPAFQVLGYGQRQQSSAGVGCKKTKNANTSYPKGGNTIGDVKVSEQCQKRSKNPTFFFPGVPNMAHRWLEITSRPLIVMLILYFSSRSSQPCVTEITTYGE